MLGISPWILLVTKRSEISKFMEQIKKTAEYTIYQKKSSRYAVRDANRKWVNGDEKIKILLGEKLIKAAMPKPKAKEEKEEKTEEGSEEKSGGEADS